MRTRVIQRKTGKFLGYCDVPWKGGMRHYVSLMHRDGRIELVRYRWAFVRHTGERLMGVALLWDVRPPELIACGFRDARHLKGFNSFDELFLHHTLGSLPARGNA